MPTPKKRKVRLAEQIREYLRTHQGPHRPLGVALALGEEPTVVAMTMRYLANKGDIWAHPVRYQNRTYMVYAHPERNVA